MSKRWFIIEDLDKFVESTRVIIFDGFGNKEKNSENIANKLSDLSKEDQDELNEVLTQNECLIMSKEFIKTQKNKVTNKTRMILDNRSYMKMIETFNSRMVGNMLNGLVNRGLLESAFDEESNDFIFWVKDDTTNKDKPETD